MNEKQIFVEYVSPFDVETTVEKLTTASIQKEWMKYEVHNLQQTLAKTGKEMRPVQVIEICKPDYSGYMLEKDNERFATIIMMPCRISVYEKEDGKTYVSLLNMAAMVTGLSESADEVIRKASKETFEIVESVIGII